MTLDRLDLGCGYRLNPGYTGIDFVPLKKLFPGVVPPHYEDDSYIEHDLWEFPWPIEDNSVEDVILRFFVDYIPHRLPDHEVDQWRGNLDGFFLFFQELYRVMKPYGKVNIIHLNPENGDPGVQRKINQYTWQYLSKDWRDESVVEDPDLDFHLESITDNGDEAIVVLSTVK